MSVTLNRSKLNSYLSLYEFVAMIFQRIFSDKTTQKGGFKHLNNFIKTYLN